MAPPKMTSGRSISQEAFNELVKENINDLGMDPTEALEDAIQTLTLQGVDLSGIITCIPGEGNVKDNPVMQRLGSGNAAIATRNGAVELVCAICSKISNGSERVLVSALKTMPLLLHDVQTTGTFHSSNGPKTVICILKKTRIVRTS